MVVAIVVRAIGAQGRSGQSIAVAVEVHAEVAAQQHVGLARVRGRGVAVGRTHQQVVESVAVQVAAAGHHRAGIVVDLLAEERGRRPIQSDVQQPALGPPQHQVGLARLERAGVAAPGPDQEVSQPIRIHVPGRGHRAARLVVEVLADEGGVRAAQVRARGPPRRPPQHQVHLARVDGRVAVAPRADHHVVQAVAVHVAHARRGLAREVVGRLAHERRVRAGQADVHGQRSTPQHQVHLPGVVAAEVTAGRGDQHVVEMIAVDVARARHHRAGQIPGELTPVRGIGTGEVNLVCGRWPAQPEVALPGRAACLVVALGTDQHVVPAVVVDITHTGHATTRVILGGLTREPRPRRGRGQLGAQRPARGAAEDQVGRARAGGGPIVGVGPDQEVGVAVVVDVPGRGHRRPGLVVCGLAQEGGRRSTEGRLHRPAAGRSQHQVHLPGGRRAVIVPRSAHQEVVEAVAVHVPDHRGGDSGVVEQHLAHERALGVGQLLLEGPGAGQGGAQQQHHDRQRCQRHGQETSHPILRGWIIPLDGSARAPA